MKCPNCSSQMFVADETISQKSHVTFFRCSLCVSEHVSATPTIESLNESPSQRAGELLGQTVARVQYAV
jgi:DNA-directed RNA polymerase subunit M/transcription elongation factor TFIIS